MASTRPQLNGDDLGRLKWLVGNVLAVFAAWSVFFMDIDAKLLLATLTLVGALGIVRPAWPAHVPAWVHRLAFPTIVGLFVADLLLSREPLAAFLRLDLLLILYRLIMHRSRREDLQLVVLGLFLIVVGGVLTVSWAFAAQILGFTACTLVLLFLLHLSDHRVDSMPAVVGQAPAWTRGSWSELWTKVVAATDWRLVLLAGGLFTALVALASGLFLALPRFELHGGLFLDRLITRSTLSGFSDRIEFGEVTEITRDTRIALSVDVPEPTDLPRVPYWRMVVLDEYTGAGFAVSPALRRQLAQVQTRRVAQGHGRLRSGDDAWTLYLESGISRYLPLLGRFHHLVFTEPQTFGLHRPSVTLALQREPARMLAYEVHGGAADDRLPDPSMIPGWRERLNLQYLEVPLRSDDRERLEQILAAIGSDFADVHTFNARATEWLHRHHRYALQSTLPEGSGDPLVRWVDSSTPGHCEYFAGSFALLARLAGYPSRIVTGFKGGAWNAYSSSFGVRNSHAHAWCEVYDEAGGAWVRVDPTPASAASFQLELLAQSAGAESTAVESGWQARMEGLRVFWYRRIVNFDQQAQADLTTAARDALRERGGQLREWLETQLTQLHEWLAQPWNVQRIGRLVAGASAAILAAVGLGLLLRRLRRSWRAYRRVARPDPIRREAGKWLQRAAHAKDLGRSFPAGLQSELLQLRYGAPERWPEPTAVFRTARQADHQARSRRGR